MSEESAPKQEAEDKGPDVEPGKKSDEELFHGDDAEGKQKNDEEKQGDEKKDDESKDEKKDEKSDDSDEDKPFELKLPEDSKLGEERVADTVKWAKETGLTEEQAQKVLERESAFVDAQETEHFKKVDAWKEEVLNDKEYGTPEALEYGKRVVDRFFGEEFRDILDETGFGNLPILVKGFAKIGKLMADDKFVDGDPVSSKKSDAELFHDHPTSKQ